MFKGLTNRFLAVTASAVLLVSSIPSTYAGGLSITKFTTYQRGAYVYYDVTIQNNGSVDATSVSTSFSVPARTTYASATMPTAVNSDTYFGNGSVDNCLFSNRGRTQNTQGAFGRGVLYCSPAHFTLSPGKSMSYTILVRVDPSVPSGTRIPGSLYLASNNVGGGSASVSLTYQK